MICVINSFARKGIDGLPIDVEVNISRGMPRFEIVGLPDTAVREAVERVRAAIRNSGFVFPEGRITVNLAPASTRKVGSTYDLPMAIGVMVASGQIRAASGDIGIIGELSLSGVVRRVAMGLGAVIAAKRLGFKQVMLPQGNALECAYVDGIDIIPVRNLREAKNHISGEAVIPPLVKGNFSELQKHKKPLRSDFADVMGQQIAKRALEIAVAGGHNIILIGEPGSGKTMMAQCAHGILPKLTLEEALEITQIHCLSGVSPSEGLVIERPYRSPSYETTAVALLGGGHDALRGEISKAHCGILFLDEMLQFSAETLDALRQPLEDGFINVVRAQAQEVYPSRFMLIGTMNPCPCGYFMSRTRPCTCKPSQVERYLKRLSGPMRDRIDMHIAVESISSGELLQKEREESSAVILERVERAREIQMKRYAAEPFFSNAQLDAKGIKDYCELDENARDVLLSIERNINLSARSQTRIIKVARTIADMERSEKITSEHITEAVQYRMLDRKLWDPT